MLSRLSQTAAASMEVATDPLPPRFRGFFTEWEDHHAFPPAEYDVSQDLTGVNCVLTPRQQLFAASVAANSGHHKLSAQWYFAAFNADLWLRNTDEFTDLDGTCQDTVGTGLALLLQDEDSGISRITDALLQSWDELQIRLTESDGSAAKRACRHESKPSACHKVPWRAVAQYAFNRLRKEPAYAIKAHSALFWASAEWVRRHGSTLISDAVFENWDDGPILRPLWKAMTDEWDRDIPLADDLLCIEEVRCIVDAAIVHVSGRTSEDISKETRRERIWLSTAEHQEFSDAAMIRAYRDDPTGILTKVFGVPHTFC